MLLFQWQLNSNQPEMELHLLWHHMIATAAGRPTCKVPRVFPWHQEMIPGVSMTLAGVFMLSRMRIGKNQYCLVQLSFTLAYTSTYTNDNTHTKSHMHRDQQLTKMMTLLIVPLHVNFMESDTFSIRGLLWAEGHRS